MDDPVAPCFFSAISFFNCSSHSSSSVKRFPLFLTTPTAAAFSVMNNVPIGLRNKSISAIVRSSINFCVLRSCSANSGAMCFTQSFLQNDATSPSECPSLLTASRPSDTIRLNAARCTALLTDDDFSPLSSSVTGFGERVR